MSKEQIERLEGAMNAGFERLDAGLERLDGGFQRLDARLERLDAGFERLARAMQAGFDTLADLQRETNERLGRLEGRFDHFLGTAGTEVRALRRDVDDLQTRVERLESDRD